MPGFRYIGTSFAEDLAFELTVKSRRVVQSPLYQKLFPEIELREDLNNKSLWSNTLGGDRYAAGTGGNIMGRHAHCIGIDDPLDPKGGRSKAKIEEAVAALPEKQRTAILLCRGEQCQRSLHCARWRRGEGVLLSIPSSSEFAETPLRNSSDSPRYSGVVGARSIRGVFSPALTTTSPTNNND